MALSYVCKRHSDLLQKMSKSSFTYWRIYPKAWFLVGFFLLETTCPDLFVNERLSASGRIWHWLGEKKRGNLMYAARQKSCTQRGLWRQFWRALWVLDYLQGGTRKPNKATNVNGIKRGRGASASDYKQQIFRSHTQQSGAFLKGNTRKMVFSLISSFFFPFLSRVWIEEVA